jgi:hypothetical protein
LVFLVFESRVNLLVVKHRWDSAALATAAILAALAAQRGRRGFWAISGALAAAAAWATPSTLWVALPLLVWAGWRNLAAILAGGATVSAAAIGCLASQHALGPMIAAMRWTAANYAKANSLPYGSVNLAGGEPGLARLASYGMEALPAILPILALLGWGWRLRRRPDKGEIQSIGPLLGAMAALVLTAWPRWSSAQLVFVAAVPFALCGILIHRVMPSQSRMGVYGAVLLMAAVVGGQKILAAGGQTEIATRAGTLRGSPEDAEYLEAFERRIQPGDSLFVFPYLPILYPLLDGHNPTRFLYLQPGMMTADDEREAIAELEAGRPRWAVTAELSPETILNAWPGSDPARIPMEAIHQYLAAHYGAVDRVGGKWGPMTILERR